MEAGVYAPGKLVNPPKERGRDPRLNGEWRNSFNEPFLVISDAMEEAVLLVVDEQKVGNRDHPKKFVKVNEAVVDGMVDVVGLGGVIIVCTRTGVVICAILVDPRASTLPRSPSKRRWTLHLNLNVVFSENYLISL